ncbi:MAG: DNA-binding protein [Deltaproteobacteria bacterium CG11_big_fil_rev_8_21_14_0_20_49_13]|nr:MAG: DNA-binding protein [Deltaproteobacteria bacterium CG11_big_fil_rev_8_21_14_0_20_49_13]
MKNKSLAADYILRAGNRLAAVEVLMQRQGYADVVRESQELIELCLKGLLRISGVEVPRIHDVSDILIRSEALLPATIKPHVKQIAKVSKSLRRDRELSFYGSEDLTPSEFYKEEDARSALEDARWIYSLCNEIVS